MSSSNDRLKLRTILAILCAGHCVPLIGGCSEVTALVFEQERCEVGGGVWGRWGFLDRESCNHRTADGGQPCIDSSECQGRCLGPDQLSGPCEGTVGECSEFRNVHGCKVFLDTAGRCDAICID